MGGDRLTRRIEEVEEILLMQSFAEQIFALMGIKLRGMKGEINERTVDQAGQTR